MKRHLLILGDDGPKYKINHFYTSVSLEGRHQLLEALRPIILSSEICVSQPRRSIPLGIPLGSQYLLVDKHWERPESSGRIFQRSCSHMKRPRPERCRLRSVD